MNALEQREQWRRLRRHVSLVESLERIAFDFALLERATMERARVALRLFAPNNSREPSVAELERARAAIALTIAECRAQRAPLSSFGELVAHGVELVECNLNPARAGRGPTKATSNEPQR